MHASQLQAFVLIDIELVKHTQETLVSCLD